MGLILSVYHKFFVHLQFLQCFFTFTFNNLHNGEKLCDYACSDPSSFRKHLRTRSGQNSNKCTLCDYNTSHTGNLRIQLKANSGEKSNKRNQCDYACSDPSSLRQHLKTHSGAKSNKCNQCDFSCFYASASRRHLQRTVEKSQTNAASVTFHPSMQVL